MDQIRSILDGSHPMKQDKYTLPVSAVEIDQFPGYVDYVKTSGMSEKVMALCKQHIDDNYASVLCALGHIERDCRRLREKMVVEKKRLDTQYKYALSTIGKVAGR